MRARCAPAASIRLTGARSRTGEGAVRAALHAPEGWRMKVTDLARCGRDGEAAVRSGLTEAP